MIVVTGGAGFIGSNLIAALEERGEHEIVVCDRLERGDKWRNLAKRELAAIVPPGELFGFLDLHRNTLETIFHLGAVSSTTLPSPKTSLSPASGSTFPPPLVHGVKNWALDAAADFGSLSASQSPLPIKRVADGN